MSRYLDARGRWTLTLVEAAAVCAAPVSGVGRSAVKAALIDGIGRGTIEASTLRKGLVAKRTVVLVNRRTGVAGVSDALLGDKLPERPTELAKLLPDLLADADDAVVRSVYPSLRNRGLWAPRSVGRISENALIKGVRETPEGELAAAQLRQGMDRVEVAVRACAGPVSGRRHAKGDTAESVSAFGARGDVRALVSEMGPSALLVPGSVPLIDAVLSASSAQGMVTLPAQRVVVVDSRVSTAVPAGTESSASEPVQVRPNVREGEESECAGLGALANVRGSGRHESWTFAAILRAVDALWDGLN